jgi:hypothetical protein
VLSFAEFQSYGKIILEVKENLFIDNRCDTTDNCLCLGLTSNRVVG